MHKQQSHRKAGLSKPHQSLAQESGEGQGNPNQSKEVHIIAKRSKAQQSKAMHSNQSESWRSKPIRSRQIKAEQGTANHSTA
jgi:hypothetical protein